MSIMQINSEGQITIPADVRERLGLLPGTEVQLEIIGDTLQLRKQPIGDRGTQLIQSLRGKATRDLTTDQIMQITRDSE